MPTYNFLVQHNINIVADDLDTAYEIAWQTLSAGYVNDVILIGEVNA